MHISGKGLQPIIYKELLYINNLKKPKKQQHNEKKIRHLTEDIGMVKSKLNSDDIISNLRHKN